MKARLPKGAGAGQQQNMNAMIRQAQKIQEEMTTLQDELDTREYDVSAGGGMVNVKINGKREILKLDIKPEIVDPEDIETLTDTVTAAVNEALRKVEEVNTTEMEKITGDMPKIPGLF